MKLLFCERPVRRRATQNRKISGHRQSRSRDSHDCARDRIRSHDLLPSGSLGAAARNSRARERASLLVQPGASLLLVGLCVRRASWKPGAGRTIDFCIDMHQYRCMSIQKSMVVGSDPAVYTDGVPGTEMMEATRAQAERFGARIIFDNSIYLDLPGGSHDRRHWPG